MTIHDFSSLQARIYDRYNDGDFTEALAELNRHTAHFPLHQNTITLWKACLASRTDQRSLALWFLEEGLAAGEWWAPQTLHREPDLASLATDPEFDRLVALCADRQREAERDAMPMRIISEPNVPPPWPALVALHGASWNGVAFARRWRAATANGWLLTAPQSTQASGPDRYGWMDRERALDECAAHLAQLATGARTDLGRVVLGGFSAGAMLALELAPRSPIPLRGVIAVGAALNPSDPDLDARATALAATGVRLALIAGRRDLFRAEGAEAFSAAFTKAGGEATLIVQDDLTHDFPADFDQMLPELLNFAAGTDGPKR